ncbi:HNH endonuclease signature motif containing protein [Halobacterium hubeiense]|uniref:HNH endonuclease signature motif containing protein n=1 Tax=Halobacterium hubeiense TaxID=1407499 RepID=UPI000B7E1372|nr:HNH endonuclease [Halobacterium hubeiense]
MTTPPARERREAARDLFWELHDSRRYTCPGCGRSRDETTSMHVHHIDGNPANSNRSNLVALCNQCHLGGVHNYDIEDPRLTKPSGHTPRPSVSAPRPGP